MARLRSAPLGTRLHMSRPGCDPRQALCELLRRLTTQRQSVLEPYDNHRIELLVLGRPKLRLQERLELSGIAERALEGELELAAFR